MINNETQFAQVSSVDESTGLRDDTEAMSSGNTGLQTLSQLQARPQTVSNGSGRSQGRGLMPTDGKDVYKRSVTGNSNNRSSRRSRAQRTSYLLATGHLDLEETKHLASETSDDLINGKETNKIQETSTNQHRPIINNKQQQQYIAKQLIAQHNEPNKIYSPTMLNINNDSHHKPGPSSLVGDHSFLDYVSMTNSNIDAGVQDGVFSRPANPSSFKSTKSKGGYSKSGSRGNGSENSRGKFQQTTYTEVNLPMKTSPAFEYILKNDRRRNRRCCLWLLYSTLVIICLALIAFSSVQLLRHHRSK